MHHDGSISLTHLCLLPIFIHPISVFLHQSENMLFDLLPLCIQHTVIRIPIMTIPAQALPAQTPSRTNPRRSIAATVCFCHRSWLRPHGSQFLKRMGQQRILALGIHPGLSARAFRSRSADLQIGILPLNIQISGRTNHFIIHLIDDYKRTCVPSTSPAPAESKLPSPGLLLTGTGHIPPDFIILPRTV